MVLGTHLHWLRECFEMGGFIDFVLKFAVGFGFGYLLAWVFRPLAPLFGRIVDDVRLRRDQLRYRMCRDLNWRVRVKFPRLIPWGWRGYDDPTLPLGWKNYDDSLRDTHWSEGRAELEWESREHSETFDRRGDWNSHKHHAANFAIAHRRVNLLYSGNDECWVVTVLEYDEADGFHFETIKSGGVLSRDNITYTYEDVVRKHNEVAADFIGLLDMKDEMLRSGKHSASLLDGML
jgi:hypothetical protein